MDYSRFLTIPNYSFFLFGPRGTGKSSILRSKLPNAFWKNLLLDSDLLPLLGDNTILQKEVEALPEGSWVVIDEVQKAPSILNVVHNLISKHGAKYKFALSGSSARKLKRLDVNLLAGRAIERKLFPLLSCELKNDFHLNEVLSFGSLPYVINEKKLAVDILMSYVGTYLKQEIQQEALVQNIESFHRFLKIAAIVNAETTNLSSISRDGAIQRTTVTRYFEILTDTLIVHRVDGWQPRLKIRETISPKYYFFDCGVQRTLSERIYSPLSDLEYGKLFETFIFNEFRASISYQNLGGNLFYWRTGAGVEVDLIWQRGDFVIGLEIKSGARWKSDFSKGLQILLSEKKIKKAFGVYLGDKNLNDNGVMVYPLAKFLELLHSGEIFSSLD